MSNRFDDPSDPGELLQSIREESISLAKRWENLNSEIDSLKMYKIKLNEEWHQLEQGREKVIQDRKRFEDAVTQEWFRGHIPNQDNSDRLVRLNIGGQVYEIAASLLLQDRFSLLAAVTVDPTTSVLCPDADGSFFFDRDWWLFRLVVAFLRDESLPRDENLLRDLHREAGFYCLGKLQRAIEMKLADLQLGISVDNNKGNTSAVAWRQSHEQFAADQQNLPFYSRVESGNYQTKRVSPMSLASGPLPDPYGFTRASAASRVASGY